jgi:hypothetical protein
MVQEGGKLRLKDLELGSSGRIPAWKAQDHEFKLQYDKKQTKRKKKETLCLRVLIPECQTPRFIPVPTVGK